MQKYIGCNKEIYACFIDYAKAFDRVQHSEMIRILEKIGIDGKDIRIIAHFYWHQKATIRSGCDISDFTSIKRGVRQGCVLSPYLFNIYTEFIFRKTSNFPGLNIGGRKFNNIRYADDTVLLTENNEVLQLLAEAVNKNSNDAGLEMNVKKTKTMVITKFPPKRHQSK
ncbi:retrovirus-related Pol polyprotein LINE-1 [Elysia marginata]|uniref:Retrovirus-related Pol polyprotein LINE-1 n=1 Tax=Elysia marginata TaxID=1093978 RepID=A0AAV4H872_9GAST|nr:retrovirus-related Pol polyprotein LINE-1 [Elysia marginata]